MLSQPTFRREKIEIVVDNKGMLLYNKSCVTAGIAKSLENTQYAVPYYIIRYHS